MKKRTAFSLIELSIAILIIGMLIAGVTQASRLIRQSKLSNAKTLTQSSSVASIPNLTMWLETTLDGSLTSATNPDSPADGDAISAWNDSNMQMGDSGKISPSQATSTKRPLYVADGIGGLPSLDFDGNNDHFRTLSGANTPIGAGDDTYTIIAVWMYDKSATSANTYIVVEEGNTSANSRIAALYISSTNTSGFVGASNNYLPLTIVKGTPYISIIRANHTLSSGNVSLFYNTNTASTGTTSAPSNLNLNNAFFEIGSLDDGAWNPFNGMISEIIVFDRNLKNAEISEINDYLSRKYSIKVN